MKVVTICMRQLLNKNLYLEHLYLNKGGGDESKSSNQDIFPGVIFFSLPTWATLSPKKREGKVICRSRAASGHVSIPPLIH